MFPLKLQGMCKWLNGEPARKRAGLGQVKRFGSPTAQALHSQQYQINQEGPGVYTFLRPVFVAHVATGIGRSRLAGSVDVLGRIQPCELR
jgi:hypothetical protein